MPWNFLPIRNRSPKPHSRVVPLGPSSLGIHVYEMVPLDSLVTGNNFFDQVYINSGTWRPYHWLSRIHPEQEEFVKF